MRQEAGARKKKTPRHPSPQGQHGSSHSSCQRPSNWQRGVVVAQAALRVAAEGDWTGGGRLARRLSAIADCRMVGAPGWHELIALLNWSLDDLGEYFCFAPVKRIASIGEILAYLNFSVDLPRRPVRSTSGGSAVMSLNPYLGS